MFDLTSVPSIDVEPTLLVDLACDTGEGPLWDNARRALSWNDIPAGTLYRYNPITRQNIIVYQHTSAIGGHTLQTDGSLVLFCADGEILKRKNGETGTIIKAVPDIIGSRFNDVAADPAGRVFCGSMPLANDESAQLHRLEPDGSLHLVWDDLGLSNGIGFSPDESIFYVSDSTNRVVYRADYDRQTGALSNRREHIHLRSDVAVPDGLTIDAGGDLWLAVWDGGCLLPYSPTGDLLARIDFPVKKVSSVNFGDADYGTAFVTTAGGLNRSGDDGPLAGSLFGVRIPGVVGKPEYRSAVML